MDRPTMQAYQTRYRDHLLKDCLPFWIHHGQDHAHGGIYNCLNRYGDIYSTDKSVWIQGRCAWLFSFLCNEYGANEQWLGIAKSCLDFLNSHCIDPTDGRMYFCVTEDGKPLRKRRYFFSESFYLIANAEYALATGEASALGAAKRYYDLIIGIYHDRSRDPYMVTPKYILETRHLKSLSEPMILLNVTSVMRKCDPQNTAKYDGISRELTAEIMNHFYRDELGMLVENITSDNMFLSHTGIGRVINPGHAMETVWFLLQEATYFHDDRLVHMLGKLFHNILSVGWDQEYGGLLSFVDAQGHPPDALEHDMKLWWPQCEAILASLMLYQTTREAPYWAWFEKLTDYAFDRFSDPEHGEWFGYLRRDGKPTEPACKGNQYKGPFHLPRMLAIADKTLQSCLQRDSLDDNR